MFWLHGWWRRLTRAFGLRWIGIAAAQIDRLDEEWRARDPDRLAGRATLR